MTARGMDRCHQYVERHSGRIVTENLMGDTFVRWIYALEREHPSQLLKILTSPRVSRLLALWHYDLPSLRGREVCAHVCRQFGLNTAEFLKDPSEFDSLRDLFERKIKFWECRPMSEDTRAVVSPADSRVLLGSLNRSSNLYLKEKFFSLDELLGMNKSEWRSAFAGGDFAIFRLTPDKYHYNHTPVAGRVVDHYEVEGRHHSCNPHAVVRTATSHSKNHRVVTIIDTNVVGGTGVGLVAMIEIVALMIGRVLQSYSEKRYENPRVMEVGMMLKKGVPKSLYRPGSSTDVLLFQPHCVQFEEDLLQNMFRTGVVSRFSQGFGRPLVETDLRVRSLLGMAIQGRTCHPEKSLGSV